MLLQILVNSLISGMLLGLVAYGFKLIFHTCKVFHLAHGGIYTLAIYSFYTTSMVIFSGKTIGLLLGMVVAGAAVFLGALIMERWVYRPLFESKVNQMISLISSLGIYIIVVNLIAIFFGNETKIFNLSTYSIVNNSELILTNVQLIQALVAISIFACLYLVQKSEIFLKATAVAEKSELAGIIGININKVRNFVFVLGSLLAGIAGVLKAIDTGFDPQVGMSVTLSAAVVAILDASNTLKGVILAALGIALVQSLTEWFLSAQWKEGMTFFILIIVMMLQTEGILAYALRTEEK